MADLLPCPFCGGNAELDTHRSYRKIGSGDLDDAVAVYCLECTADHMACRADHIGLTTNDLVDIVSAAWNRRPEGAGWQAGFDAARKMVESVTSHASWGPKATLDFAFQHGMQVVKDVFKRRKEYSASPPITLPAAPVDGGENA